MKRGTPNLVLLMASSDMLSGLLSTTVGAVKTFAANRELRQKIRDYSGGMPPLAVGGNENHLQINHNKT